MSEKRNNLISAVSVKIWSLRLIILTLTVLLISVYPGAAEEKILFSCPEKAYLGRPFEVSLSSKRKLDSLKVVWLGKERNAEIIKEDNNHYTTSFILGTDVSDHVPGDRLLKVYLVSGEDRAAFSWQIKVLADDFPEERFTVNQNMVTPPPEVMSRIKKERALIHKALLSDSVQSWWSLPFSRPLDGKVTSCYGSRRVINNTRKYNHTGVDYRAAVGTEVRSVSAGKVVLAGDLYFSGKSVYVHHGNGIVSMYFHLSRINVKEGDFAKKGDLVGLSGSTGRVTGPHLHLGVSLRGDNVDPEPLFNREEKAQPSYQLDVF